MLFIYCLLILMGFFDDRWNFDLIYLDIFFVGGCRILWIYMIRYIFKGYEFGLSNVSNNEKKIYR